MYKDMPSESPTATANLTSSSSNAEQFSMRRNLWFIKHGHIDYKNNFFITFARPMAFLLSPTILWTTITYAVTVGGFTTVGVIVPQIFSAPPYNFSSGSQGLFSLSGLIGIVLGGSVGSKAVDMFNLRQEKRWLRQGHLHKPEERLIMLIVPGIFAPAGLVMYSAFVKKKIS
jgi:hypothetical protein